MINGRWLIDWTNSHRKKIWILKKKISNLEVSHIDHVESNQRGKQTDIGFGENSPAKITFLRQD